MHARRKSSPRAFTLLEVLVSLAIFALAAVVLSATYVNILTSYDAVAHRNEHEQDLRLVSAQLLSEPDRKKAEGGGDFALPDHRTARWKATIEESAVADLFKVKFRCELRDAGTGKPWAEDETFMLLRPTWSDPAARDKLRASAQDASAKRNSR
ncbi:MAG: type II secretion system protein [Opitutae bacterium]|nr:type II secretion system protein [Opitutae bacterium]